MLICWHKRCDWGIIDQAIRALRCQVFAIRHLATTLSSLTGSEC
jgi:hypothetical protein